MCTWGPSHPSNDDDCLHGMDGNGLKTNRQSAHFGDCVVSVSKILSKKIPARLLFRQKNILTNLRRKKIIICRLDYWSGHGRTICYGPDKKYRSTQYGVDYLAYARIRHQARWECRKANKEFERSLAKEAKSNPKAVFSYANSRMKTRSGIADLQTEEGTAVTDLEKSEALNDFFSNVFTIERDGPTPQLAIRDIQVAMPHLEITEAMVKKKLDGLNPNKSAGPDGLHPRVLSEFSEVISKPLATIMQKSLTEEQLPQSWKDAHISPVFTKGSKSQRSNYRPISLTSVVSTCV